jgi:predicted CXXCH cytochrome family protein
MSRADDTGRAISYAHQGFCLASDSLCSTIMLMPCLRKFSVSQGFVRLAAVIAVTAAAVLLAYASPALAYDPFDPPTGKSCAECHGLEGGEASGTVEPTRKGPHGGYGITTRKCATCHSVHGAEGSLLFLSGNTISEVCASCHDGTGGKGVYGVIESRTGAKPVAIHSIEETRTIPGGDPSGGPREGSFSGPGRTLTCVDCHSPHDSNTVAAFTGDRARAPEGSESATSGVLPTNRLLRKLERADGTAVERYGSDWCAACHRGYHLADDGTDLASDESTRHPVAFETEGNWHYDRVRVVAGSNTTETAWGSLGGSNRGYVMPHDSGDMNSHLEDQQGIGPICQQCHEDARDVGGILGGSPVLLPEQEFRVRFYPEDGASEPEPTDNPRFQVFPHESDQPAFRVTRSDPEKPLLDTFCLRCHVP